MVILPSGVTTQIVAVEGNLPAVRVQLADEIDASRGDVIAAADDPPHTVPSVVATVAWMHDKPLLQGAHVLIKHATRTLKAVATVLHDKLDVTTLASDSQVSSIGLNEIGTVSFITSLSLPIDPYVLNRTMGSFIVIDPVTNATVGAGMINR